MRTKKFLMSSILILPLPLPFPLSQVKRNPDDIGHAFLGYQRSLGWLSGQEVGSRIKYCQILKQNAPNILLHRILSLGSGRFYLPFTQTNINNFNFFPPSFSQDLYDPLDWQNKSYPKGHFKERYDFPLSYSLS